MLIERLNPRESIGFLLYKSARLCVNAFANRLEKAGLDISVEQWRLLIPLSRYPGISQRKLAELASQEKTGVSRLLSGLESKGYVRREDDPEDRRVKRLFATEKGLDLLDRTVDLAHANNASVAEGIDPEEFAVCKKVLLQIILNHMGDHDCAAFLRGSAEAP